MTTLMPPRSIKASNAAKDEDAQALRDGIARTARWARSRQAGFKAGDKILPITVPGHERIVHIRENLRNARKMEVRTYHMRPARPCPGCGLTLYGIGEVQTATAPWHLACWERDQAARSLTIPIDFDAEGLPIVEGRAKGRGRPRRRHR